jgi:hypothetical protein
MRQHHEASHLPPSAINARKLKAATRWAVLLLCLAAGGCTQYDRTLDPRAVINCSNITHEDEGGAGYLACVQEQMALLHPQAQFPAATSATAG